MNRNIKISKNMILVTTILFFLVIVVWISEKSAKQEEIETLTRDSYGGSVRTEKFQVEIDGEKEEIEIQISPRAYQRAEVQLLLREAMEMLDIVVLAGNKSFHSVDTSLALPSSLDGYPFMISWELSRYDVLTLSGEILQEELKMVDPDNQGVPITLKATLVYEDIQAEYQKEAVLFSKEEEHTVSEQLEEFVKEVDESTREDEVLTLPKTWNGSKLTWETSEESSVPIAIGLSLLVLVLLGLREKQMVHQKDKEKKEEMLVDYPEIISQFTMLMGAGMTAKNVWAKVTEDYKAQKKKSGRTRAAYEEMLVTWQEMQSGVPESECYERFAKRCELLPYMKMGVLLSQNLRKGSKGLAEMLALEAVAAMEERKARARKLGEEAGTKLLIPMTMMLVVVFAIVVVPAFWAAQI